MRPRIYHGAMDILSLFTIIFMLAASIFLLLVSLLGLLWAVFALCRRCGKKRIRVEKIPESDME